MKLSESVVTIESSGDMEEKFFSIQNEGMIFDILRNKMYSDPILAICREISCNARDAHREIGKNDVSIQITLPTTLEPFYKIKDFGPGISPDRMENVFIQYTASTKRNDNIQTGGFGLGAKTPFSYSDTFTITTVVDFVKYNYACFIDETKIGKLILMGKEPCEDSNGTEIIIPVKQNDFNKFFVATEECTRHWDVKPIIRNGIINWKTFASKLTGSSWKIATFTDNNNRNSYGYHSHNEAQYDRGLKIIIDGIEYHVSRETIKKIANVSIIDACRGFVFLYFNIGELSLAANRESIYIDKLTETKISERLSLVKDEMSLIINDNVSKFSSYLEANSYYMKDLKDLFTDISVLNTLKWNGTPLYGNSINMQLAVTEFYRSKILKGKSAGEEKIKNKVASQVFLSKNTKLYFNDCDISNLSYKHVKKALEDSAVDSVQVISPHKNKTFEDLDTEWSLTGLGFEMLSTIAAGITVKPRAVSTNKLLVFKLDHSYTMNLVPYSSIEEDVNKVKVLALFEKDDYYKSDKRIVLDSGKVLYGEVLQALKKSFPDVSFYAVKKDTSQARINSDFPNFKSIEDFILENIDCSLNECIEIKAIGSVYGSSYIESDMFPLLKNKITDSNSPFLKRIKIFEAVNTARDKMKKVLLYEAINGRINDSDIKKWIIDHPDYNYDKYNKQCIVKYPLLHTHYMHSVPVEHIALYINFVDSL